VPRRRSSGSVQSGRSRVCAKKNKERRQRNMKPEAVGRSAGHPSTRHRFASFIVCRLLVGAPGSRWRAFGFRGARPGWQRRHSSQDVAVAGRDVIFRQSDRNIARRPARWAAA